MCYGNRMCRYYQCAEDREKEKKNMKECVRNKETTKNELLRIPIIARIF